MEKDIGRYREELVSGLTGEILEVGCGNGMNFSHYGANAVVSAMEPEPFLREKATEAARSASADITVVEGTAESLPFEDASFGTVVACLVLCSVGDQAASLREVKRVLKPGGSLYYLEHVHSDRPSKARFQKALDRSRVWPTIAGGCRCGCDTVNALSADGFEIVDNRPITIGPAWGHTNPHVIGHATIA